MRRLRRECENDASDRESKPGCYGRDYLIIVQLFLYYLWIHARFVNKEVRRMKVAMLIGLAVMLNLLLFRYCRVSMYLGDKM